jgi:hypothetical protein
MVKKPSIPPVTPFVVFFSTMISTIVPVIVSTVAAPGTIVMVTALNPVVVAMMMSSIVVAAGITALTVIMRHVYVVIPVFFHKIDRLVAGIVTVAIFIPSFGVTRRHIEINRRRLDDSSSGR